MIPYFNRLGRVLLHIGLRKRYPKRLHIGYKQRQQSASHQTKSLHRREDKRVRVRGERMEDADFVADSEDELHSEEDLVACRPAGSAHVGGSGGAVQSYDNHDAAAHVNRADTGESAALGPRVFKVGDLVEVESRTWPGINKPGGSGRVVNVHQETNSQGEGEVFYDVRYVLGGFERRIESEYVELSHILQLERAQGRVRYERVFYHGTLRMLLLSLSCMMLCVLTSGLLSILLLQTSLLMRCTRRRKRSTIRTRSRLQRPVD